jgi:hypothetical protein
MKTSQQAGIVCLTFLLAAPLVAQGVLQGSPERRLNLRPQYYHPTELSLAVNAAGEAMITRGDTTVWIDSRAQLLDRTLPPKSFAKVLALDGEHWYGVFSRRQSSSQGNTQGWHESFKLCRGEGSVIQDSSDVVASIHQEHGMVDPWSSSSWIEMMNGWRDSSIIVLETHELSSSSYEWGGGVGAYTAVHRWTSSPPILKTLSERHDWHESEYPLTLNRISRPFAGDCALYRRDRIDGPHDTLNRYVRYLSRFNIKTGKMRETLIIDTLDGAELDYSDAVLPFRSHGYEILRKDTQSDSLYIERVDTATLDIRKLFLFGPVCVNVRDNKADYALHPLNDGTTLLAWVAVRSLGDTVLLVARFDQEWQVIGAVKQAHASGPGARTLPVLAVQGSRVYLCWQHRQSENYWVPWIRIFDIDVLSNAIVSERPSELQVGDVYPHPVGSLLHMQITAPADSRGRLRALCYDIRGQLVFERTLELPGGSAVFRQDTGHLHPGTYTLVFLAGDRKSLKTFLLIR